MLGLYYHGKEARSLQVEGLYMTVIAKTFIGISVYLQGTCRSA